MHLAFYTMLRPIFFLNAVSKAIRGVCAATALDGGLYKQIIYMAVITTKLNDPILHYNQFTRKQL